MRCLSAVGISALQDGEDVNLSNPHLATQLKYTVEVVEQLSSLIENQEPPLSAAQKEHLIAAGWLQKIGRSPALKKTGYPPIDGALYLQNNGFHNDVVHLVAFQYDDGRRGIRTPFAMPRDPRFDILLRLLTQADLMAKRICATD